MMFHIGKIEKAQPVLCNKMHVPPQMPLNPFMIAAKNISDIGIAPTLFSDSRHGERNLGGHFHFTSFVSVGMRLDRSSSLSLRIQHTSNGGIRDTNPGMDMLGLEFSYNFSE